jgi:hypothetical protein
MLDAREPPNGDFVVYVEKIEREQLARAMQPHKLAQLPEGGKASAESSAGSGARALSATDAQRVLQMLKAPGRNGAAAPLGTMISVVIGAALIAFGLMAEGGIVLVLLGAVLLWHSLRKLRSAAGAAAGSPAQQVDAVFARKASATTHKAGG